MAEDPSGTSLTLVGEIDGGEALRNIRLARN